MDSNPNDWVYSNKYEYSYDLVGNRTLYLSFKWDLNLNGWIKVQKNEYSYDLDGNQTLWIAYKWNSYLNDWVYSTKNEYSYDLEGEQILEISNKWDLNLDDWIPNRKHEYSYDLVGNRTLHIFYWWDSNPNDWIYYSKDYYYNYHYNTESEAICQGDSLLWQGSYYKTMGLYLTKYTSIAGCESIYEINLIVNPRPESFEITGPASVPENEIQIYSVPSDSTISYIWSITNGNTISYPSTNSAEILWGIIDPGYIYVVSTNQYGCISDTAKLEVNIGSTDARDIVNNENIKIYPNPANENLVVLCNEDFIMEIYDLSGRKLIVSEKKETDISYLSKGIYLVKIVDKKGALLLEKKIVIH